VIGSFDVRGGRTVEDKELSMASVQPHQEQPALTEMHNLYRDGGKARDSAPHVVYRESGCPYLGCDQNLQAIDFRLEAVGRNVHDPLVRAWWDDIGFAGRCPKCRGWIHFTIRGQNAIRESEASRLPQLPDNWADEATIL
jgi:hypothetical protein